MISTISSNGELSPKSDLKIMNSTYTKGIFMGKKYQILQILKIFSSNFQIFMISSNRLSITQKVLWNPKPKCSHREGGVPKGQKLMGV
jgi:hypothetical protein